MIKNWLTKQTKNIWSQVCWFLFRWYWFLTAARWSASTFQLRYLQTLNSISAENNSTIVFPVPVDIITNVMMAKSTSVHMTIIVLLRINVKTLILLLKLWMYGQQFLTILIARVETYVWLKCITGSTMWKFLPQCSFQELLRIHKGYLDLFLRHKKLFYLFLRHKDFFGSVFATQKT